jgi:hypothetical protein
MRIPLDKVLLQHVAVLGKTGSGKSSVMRSFVEWLLMAKEPVCIIDPKGDWWGLKSSADGKSAGFPVVIFGGEHADVPINAHSGGPVSELVATGNRPCIIDLGGWTVADRTRFFVDFASLLFRHSRGRRWLVIDEVHNFSPQGKVMDPQAGHMLHWANRLASEGRGKGIQLIAASQRPQKVHKDFLTSCETLVAMRVIHPLDRNAIKDWIDGCPDAAKGKEVLGDLASMPRGTGWVWSPEIGFGPERIAFQKFRTYDSFSPSAGAHAKLKGWADVDLEEVKSKLAVVVQEAEANDPKLLRKKVSELEVQLSKLKNHAVRELPVIDAEQIHQAHHAGVAIGRADVLSGIPKLEAAVHGLEQVTNQMRAAVSAFSSQLDAPIPVPRWKPEPKVYAKRMPIVIQSGPGDASIGNSGKRRMLTALAQNPNGLTYTKLSILTGISQSGGTWRTYLGELRGHNLVDPGEPVRITQAGLKALGNYEPLPTGQALIDYWRSRLGRSGKRAIFDVVLAAYPRGISQEDASARTGISMAGGTWRTYLGELRGLELIVGRGELRASEELF